MPLNFTKIGSDIADFWLPDSPENINLEYSIYINDPSATPIENIAISEEFMAFPNPAKDLVKIDLSSSKHKINTYSVIGLDGSFVSSGQINPANMSILINCENWSNGLYIVLLYGDSTIIPVKFVKE